MPIEVLELELTVIKADGLAPKDTNMFGFRTSSDPYVEVRLCPHGPLQGHGKKILVGKTKTIEKSLKPTWDQTFITSLPKNQFTEFAVFELTIMDDDNGKNEDNLMGVVPVHIPIRNSGSTTKWYGVPASSGEGEQASGRVQCTLTTERKMLKPGEIPLAMRQQAAAEAENDSGKKRTSIFSMSKWKSTQSSSENAETTTVTTGTGRTKKIEVVELDITVTRAKGLMAMDSNFIGMKAKSDPYIEVRLCPQGPSQGNDTKILLGKTPPKLKTLDPTWRNQTFSATLPLDDFSQSAMFELTIMDYDESNDDDLMGVVPVPIPLGKSGITTNWYDVPASSAGDEGDASGKVECVLSMHKEIQEIEAPSEESPAESTAAEEVATKQETPAAQQATNAVPAVGTSDNSQSKKQENAGISPAQDKPENDDGNGAPPSENIGDQSTQQSSNRKEESANTDEPDAPANMRIGRLNRRSSALVRMRTRSSDDECGLRRTATTGGIQRRQSARALALGLGGSSLALKMSTEKPGHRRSSSGPLSDAKNSAMEANGSNHSGRSLKRSATGGGMQRRQSSRALERRSSSRALEITAKMLGMPPPSIQRESSSTSLSDRDSSTGKGNSSGHGDPPLQRSSTTGGIKRAVVADATMMMEFKQPHQDASLLLTCRNRGLHGP